VSRRIRPRIAVVGGAGAMGRITVRDLAETAGDVEIVVADRDAKAARRLARSLPRPVRVVEADASDPSRLTRVLDGASVLINACHHDFNLRVMDAALALGAHYCDLGGLFHVTRQQLTRDDEFRAAGLLALCGMGSAPGIVNVMARSAADRMDRVHEIHVAVGTSDRTRRKGASLLDTSYSILTVLDEASQPAALFTGGKLTFVDALSHAVRVDFPQPVGTMEPACTLHSEVATLPESFRAKGVREVSFRIAFPGGLMDRLRFVHALGLTATTPLQVGSAEVVPRQVLLALLQDAPKATVVGPRNEYEVLRVTVSGRQAGRAVTEVVDCHVPGMPAWDVGVDIDTGAPPSIAAQMLVSGEMTARGVLPPERAVPAPSFFRALAGRRMRIVRRRTGR
jgi:saccharopine dehydrogenase-like NADP-dependent oxidoreductase